MEPLELFCCLLEVVDFGTILANGIAWSRSRPNRIARKEAKKAGDTPPEREGWTTAYQILTPMAIALTVLVILKWTRVLR